MSLDKRRDAIKDEHIMIEVQEENARLAEIDRQKAEIIRKENRFSEPTFIRKKREAKKLWEDLKSTKL
jgi:hypothetical protein